MSRDHGRFFVWDERQVDADKLENVADVPALVDLISRKLIEHSRVGSDVLMIHAEVDPAPLPMLRNLIEELERAGAASARRAE